MRSMIGCSNHSVITSVCGLIGTVRVYVDVHCCAYVSVLYVYMLMFIVVRMYHDCSDEYNLVTAHLCTVEGTDLDSDSHMCCVVINT
jgi:hypothetical protein